MRGFAGKSALLNTLNYVFHLNCEYGTFDHLISYRLQNCLQTLRVSRFIIFNLSVPLQQPHRFYIYLKQVFIGGNPIRVIKLKQEQFHFHFCVRRKYYFRETNFQKSHKELVKFNNTATEQQNNVVALEIISGRLYSNYGRRKKVNEMNLPH